MDDNRDDLEPPERRAPKSEGVRIIGAQEAAEAVASGSAGTRREKGERGRGDRPADPAPADDRPVFKLPSAGGGPKGSFDQVPMLGADEDPSDIVSGAVTGTFEMPHYSDPPTGQVPKVVVGDDEPDESWAATTAMPRWRDDAKSDEVDDFSDLIDEKGVSFGTPENDAAADEFFSDEFDTPTSGYDESTPTVEDDPEDEEELLVPVPDSRRDAARSAVRRNPRPEPRRDPNRQQHSAPSGGRNLPVAVGVGVGLLVAGALCFKLGAVATSLLVSVILTLCAVEFFNTLRAAGYNPATLLGIVGVPALVLAPLFKPALGYPIAIGLIVIAAMIWFFWVNPGHGSVGNLGVSLLGVLWIGGLGSFATLILGLGRTVEEASKLSSNPGIGVIWGVVLVTVCYDVGAFFVGQFFGRTPLSTASPNKTVEGLIGGIAIAIAVPVLILMYGNLGDPIAPLGLDFAKVFPFCLFCALIAPLGDLCQSAIKRDLDVKDMGDLLPGHGGVLDRFDGFLFVLPVAWFMVHLLQLGVKAAGTTLLPF